VTNPRVRRCAIYTRKSSEEGLEQDFNSLQAQREACEAYIRSQRHEGWRLIEAPYDDGGLSGATMERPGLQRLLGDIGGNRVDTIVVYKVDRLTRSLADFAKMVELFDAHGVSFVAVTQQFNTTTSMGRLTLNVLLSFAQFEREVTGERIRDKIAASKKKGMWMGGNVPLGYDVRDRKLLINRGEAGTVQQIFQRYAALGSVRRLKEELDRDGIKSKPRAGKTGQPRGGRPFSRGALYQLLSNPLYIGEIRHKGVCHPGQHEPILNRRLWDRAQQQLRENGSMPRPRRAKVDASPLAGKLFDEAGERLTPSHATKNGRRYRYYVSRHLVTSAAGQGQPGWRLPAREIEQAVAEAAGMILDDTVSLTTGFKEAGLDTRQLPAALTAAESTRRKLVDDGSRSGALQALIDRVELRPDGLGLTLRLKPHLAEAQHNRLTIDPRICRIVPLQIKRRGIESRLIIGTGSTEIDVPLLKVVARAHRWFTELALGEVTSLVQIARREGVSDQFIGNLLPLAFLSPKIVAAIAEGRQPRNLIANALIKSVPALPLDWATQLQRLGFAE
jgi:site-specific DNA recombinase